MILPASGTSCPVTSCRWLFCLFCSLCQDVWGGREPTFCRGRSYPEGQVSGTSEWAAGPQPWALHLCLAFFLLPPVCLATDFTALARRPPMPRGTSLCHLKKCARGAWIVGNALASWGEDVSSEVSAHSYCFPTELTGEEEAVESILQKGKLRPVGPGQIVKGCISSPLFSPDELEVKGVIGVAPKRGKCHNGGSWQPLERFFGLRK